VRAIIDDYLSRPATDFDVAEYGFALDGLEQRRRWLLKSLLRADGVSRAGYATRFGSTVDDDFPQLTQLARSRAGMGTGSGSENRDDQLFRRSEKSSIRKTNQL
jgi:oxygen-independent coproporphyrinogen-3 oxidase